MQGKSGTGGKKKKPSQKETTTDAVKKEADTNAVFTFSGAVFPPEKTLTQPLEDDIGGAISVSFVARFDEPLNPSGGRILDFGSGLGIDNIIVANVDRGLCADIFVDSRRKRLLIPGAITPGETHKYLFTVKQNGQMQFLRDGEVIGEMNRGRTPACHARKSLNVGGAPWAQPEGNFRGQLDDLRLWRDVVDWDAAFPQVVEAAIPAASSTAKAPVVEEEAPAEAAVAAEAAQPAEAAAAAAAVEVVEATPAKADASPEEDMDNSWKQKSRRSDKKGKKSQDKAHGDGHREETKVDEEPKQQASERPEKEAEEEKERAAAQAKEKEHAEEERRKAEEAKEARIAKEKEDKARRKAEAQAKKAKEAAEQKEAEERRRREVEEQEAAKAAQEEAAAALAAAAASERKRVAEAEEEQARREQRLEQEVAQQQQLLMAQESQLEEAKAPEKEVRKDGDRKSEKSKAKKESKKKKERKAGDEDGEKAGSKAAKDSEPAATAAAAQDATEQPAPQAAPEVEATEAAVSSAEAAILATAPPPLAPVVPEVVPSPMITNMPLAQALGLQPAAEMQVKTPLDKEVMKLEKKVREIEKLKQRLAEGETLESLQQQKIAKGDEIQRQLTELQLQRQQLQMEALQKQAAAEAAAAPVGRTPLRAPSRGGAALNWSPSTTIPGVTVPLAAYANLGVPVHRTPLGIPAPATRLSSGALPFGEAAAGVPAPPKAEDDASAEGGAGGDASKLGATPLVLGEQAAVAAAVPEHWNCCWEWVNQGWCPRGISCRWQHPPHLAYGGSVPFWIAGGAADQAQAAGQHGVGAEAAADKPVVEMDAAVPPT
eukprot:TRINITY_DN49306_c0_g1_i1.p1 TRINITY_DN49306_c0_g1~~TRINITY_DN49306_c0_g1_i1.p1  ORF type:complete len:829 (+),score=323.97 TRINITY_DN49306_c0_g1_i1:249-2735(+)